MQLKYLSETFDPNDWLYVDVASDSDALSIAHDIHIENIPSLVVLNNKFQEIFRRDGGIVPPDQIFNKVRGNNSFPIKSAEKVKQGFVLLSYEPEFSPGNILCAENYKFQKLCSVKIKTSEKYELNELRTKLGDQIVDEYLSQGGRRNWAYLVNFEVQQ